MANFETFYPIDGSNPLKAQSCAEKRAATIISFPGAQPERTAENPTGYEQLTSLFTKPFNKRFLVQNLKHGTLAGSSFSSISKLKGTLSIFAVAAISFFLFFI